MAVAIGVLGGCQSGAESSASQDRQRASEAKAAAAPGYYDEAPMEEEGAVAAAQGGQSFEAPSSARAAAPESRPPASSAAKGKAKAEPAQARLVVYTAWLRIAVHEVEQTLAAADALASRLGGYVQSSTTTQRVLRVPSAHYQEALRGLQALGEVRDLRQSSRDVTEAYTNLEARIENLQALRTRYTELLASATTMDERLAIERELRRIAQELRVLEEQRRYLADQAAFATITVDVERIQPATVVRNRRPQPFRWVGEYGLSTLFG